MCSKYKYLTRLMLFVISKLQNELETKYYYCDSNVLKHIL